LNLRPPPERGFHTQKSEIIAGFSFRYTQAENSARERFTARRRSVSAMMLFSAVPTRANIYSVK
jgi:hypothetical protein